MGEEEGKRIDRLVREEGSCDRSCCHGVVPVVPSCGCGGACAAGGSIGSGMERGEGEEGDSETGCSMVGAAEEHAHGRARPTLFCGTPLPSSSFSTVAGEDGGGGGGVVVVVVAAIAEANNTFVSAGAVTGAGVSSAPPSPTRATSAR